MSMGFQTDLIKNSILQCTGEEKNSKSVFDLVFMAFDRDGDGFISADDF